MSQFPHSATAPLWHPRPRQTDADQLDEAGKALLTQGRVRPRSALLVGGSDVAEPAPAQGLRTLTVGRSERSGSDRARARRPKQTTVWQAASPIMAAGPGPQEDTATRHPTQKPLLLFERPILNHTRRGEIVYEPFAGSGSCLIAAEKSDLHDAVYGPPSGRPPLVGDLGSRRRDGERRLCPRWASTSPSAKATCPACATHCGSDRGP